MKEEIEMKKIMTFLLGLSFFIGNFNVYAYDENNKLTKETKQDIEDTVRFVNSHKLQGVKIHSTYVVENTILADMYRRGEYQALDLDDYIETLIDILTHLNPNFVIHRVSGDAPKDILVAPSWNKHKMWILHGFEKRFEARDLWQGKFYQANGI